jgi:hypothetical protein
MIYEVAALSSGRIVETERGRIAAIEKNHTFQARHGRRQRDTSNFSLGAAGDSNLSISDNSSQTLAGPLADFRDRLKIQPGGPRRVENGGGERMLRVALQARHQPQNGFLLKTGGTNDFMQFRFAVSERSSFVEDPRVTLLDLFQHGRVLDDDAAARRLRPR